MKRISYKHLQTFLSTFLSVGLFLASCGQNKPPGDARVHTNALIEETSPYLLQHAHNPVNWRPWSPRALEDAEAEGKLVIISIGYSSCHWCHVMEEETFEDDEVAALMNEQFVSIKVDREERPDIDHVYMTAAQLLTGAGGWPLNVITLPDGKPIYAGTYHPRDQWIRVLEEISTLFKESPDKARAYADKVARGIQSVNLVQPVDRQGGIREEILLNGLRLWQDYWDLEWGGNRGQQKFMMPSNLDFLLEYAEITADTLALQFVKTTLDRMSMGGVYDQVGGGFFRYSTDPYWQVPHFEKMLYDNAQLLSLYSRAYSRFKNPRYKEIAYQIAKFLERDMKHPGGAYLAAIDADSNGGEGAYYLWKGEQLKALLGGDFPLFAAYFSIEEEKALEDGNFVLHSLATDASFAEEHDLELEDLQAKKEKWRGMLLAEREGRMPPGIDDKVITSWNALLISGYVDAYSAFGEEAFLEHAMGINRFLSKYNRDGDKLLHSYKTGSRRIEGFLEDYAQLAKARLDLYLATGREAYFREARSLIETANKIFYEEGSGFYRFKENDELIAKIIKTNDGVIPSPNTVMAQNLFTMGHIIYDPGAIERAAQMLQSMAANIEASPDSYSGWSKLMLQFVRPYYEIAIVGPNAAALHKEMIQAEIPNTLLIATDTVSEMPLFKNRYVQGMTYIYVCQDHSCRLPVTSVAGAVSQLQYQ